MNGSVIASSNRQEHSISSLTVWKDKVVTGSGGSISYWKIICSQDDIQLVRTYFRDFRINVQSITVWDDKLYATGVTQTPVIKSYNKKGRHIQSYHNLHGDTVNHMIVFRGLLWTASSDTTVCAWKKNWLGYKLKCVKRFTSHSRPVMKLASWGQDRVVSAAADNSVRVWNINGQCLYIFETNLALSMMEWTEGRLACVTTSISTTGSPHFILWNKDGTQFFSQEAPHFPMALLAVDNVLWETSGAGIHVWETRNWKIERILWLGWKKGNPAFCSLALLPQDVFLRILQYVTF